MQNKLCVICGTKEEITEHHLTERTLRKSGKFKKPLPTIVIDLCRPCHDLVELEKVRMKWSLKLQQAKEKAYKQGYDDALERRREHG